MNRPGERLIQSAREALDHAEGRLLAGIVAHQPPAVARDEKPK